MTSQDQRRLFLRSVVASAAVPLWAQAPASTSSTQASTSASASTAPPKKIPDRGPALEPTLVKAFVGAGHGNLDKVKEMLGQTPGLLNATWDWGGGDFETALGGASHMGRRDIAQFLIEQGARMDLFAAAMMGKLDVVRAAVTAFPGSHLSLGPHKIPLIEHARKGGAEAAAVVEFLSTLPTK